MSVLYSIFMSPLGPALVMFVYVFLKAFQQRNVAFDAKPWNVMLISYGMALTEAFVIVTFVRVGYHLPTVLSIGTGAGFGALLAMYIHRKLFGIQGK